MTVKDLINLLKQYPPETKVFDMACCQEMTKDSWEYSINEKWLGYIN